MRTRQQEINEMLKENQQLDRWAPRARTSGTSRLTENTLGRSRHRV